MTAPAAPRRILVVALDNLGDAVMASCVLEPLKRIFPEAKLGLWAKAYAAALFEGHPSLDAVHAADPVWDRSPGKAKGAAGPFLRTLRDIRAAGYDTALILNAEWRRALCCALAGIPVRAGYDARKSGLFLTHALPAPGAGSHFSDDHLRLVQEHFGRPLGGGRLPSLAVSEEDERWRREWSAANGLEDGAYTVLHPFSGDEEKNWPLPAWAELISRRPGERFVILCGPGEEARLGPLKDELPRRGAVLLSSPPLGRLKAALSRARLVVGGDSGPEHVAAALGVRVLSLFGPTEPGRSAPRGRGQLKVLHPLSLRDLSVGETLAAMDACRVGL